MPPDDGYLRLSQDRTSITGAILFRATDSAFGEHDLECPLSTHCGHLDQATPITGYRSRIRSQAAMSGGR
jgi:hypothetical protein